MSAIIALFIVLMIVYTSVAFIVGMIDNFGESLVLGFSTFMKLKKRGQIEEIYADRIWYRIDGMDHRICPCWTWYPILWLMVFCKNMNANKLKID